MVSKGDAALPRRSKGARDVTADTAVLTCLLLIVLHMDSSRGAQWPFGAVRILALCLAQRMCSPTPTELSLSRQMRATRAPDADNYASEHVHNYT